MDKKNHPLTNEVLAKKFKNNFELVNYAIKLAENMIRKGRDARVKSDIQNRAMLVLDEIIEGKDQFDSVPENMERKLDQHGEEKKTRYEERPDRSEQRVGRTNRSGLAEQGDYQERNKVKFTLSEE